MQILYTLNMEKYNKILSRLRHIIPNPVCELNFKNNFELLVAVILSAQCTDKRVNMVTEELFKEYDTPEKLANANIQDIEKIIMPCGFYKNKARHIIHASKQLLEKFDGQVPQEIEELMLLPGVGRKTANVVRAVGFKIPAIAVDTHVFRVSNRLGLAHAKDVRTCEKQLMKNINESDWIDAHHLILLFGRYYCKAISPKCKECPFVNECKYNKEKNK